MARRADDKSKCVEEIDEAAEADKSKCVKEFNKATEADKSKCVKEFNKATEAEKSKCVKEIDEAAEADKSKCVKEFNKATEADKSKCVKEIDEAAEADKRKCVKEFNEAAEGAEAAAVALNRLSIVSSHKKLLVLDLNGLLAHTFFKVEKVTIPSSRKPDGVSGKKFVFKRPYCDEFLQFCFERFEVAIWSSAMKMNVDGALSCVMSGAFKDRLLFIWDQTDCTDTGFKAVENKNKPLFLKELKKIWDGGRTYLLRGGKPRFSSSNTLLIDDSPYKALLNPPNTGIFPHPYKVDQTDDFSLAGENGVIREFLEGLAAAVEVPSYVAAHPLGQPAITSKHPDWEFYSDIISHLSVG